MKAFNRKYLLQNCISWKQNSRKASKEADSGADDS